MKMKERGKEWEIIAIIPKIYFVNYKYFLKTIKKMTNQQKNRQNWVFNKISIYPINLLKSGFINHHENAKTRLLLYKPTRMLQLKSDHIKGQ